MPLRRVSGRSPPNNRSPLICDGSGRVAEPTARLSYRLGWTRFSTLESAFLKTNPDLPMLTTSVNHKRLLRSLTINVNYKN
jgi:hypothetical protein